MSKKNIDARVSMFGRLAVESGLVTYEDIVACIEEQEKYRANGEAAPKLGELLVIRGLLSEQEVEMILKMQANPGGLIGRQLLERGLVTREQLREALDEQAEYVQNGMTPPRIGEMLVEKGVLKREDLEQVLKKKEAPSGNFLGEFLVNHRLVKAEDVSRCLAIQKHATEQGEKAPRLGELLVSCGILRQEQVDLYTRRHAQERRKVSPAIASTVGVATTEPSGAEKRRKLRRRVGDYELLENIGQHYDGVTYRALHTGSGAIVVLHQFNLPSETIARSITGMTGQTTGLEKGGSVPVPRTVTVPNSAAPAVAAAPSPVPDVPAATSDSDRFNVEVEVVVDAIHATDGFSEKIDKAMRLRGPSNQIVLASEQFNGRAVIADYIEGVTLERVVSEKGKMEWTWAAEILYDLSAILAQAESMDLYHDDIRPGSIFIDAAGKARLGLWCYTRNPVDNRDWLAHKHHPIAFYFAPERVAGMPSVKADIFSLGVTMVHILTGTAPVRGNSAADAASRMTAGQITQDMVMDMDLPMELIDLVSNMVDPNPANRPASFADIRERVGRLAEAEQLEFDIASTAVSVKEAMSLEEAKTVIGRFLSAALPSRETKRVTWRQLARYFLAPFAAMVLLMVGVTVMYKTTQSSHGLMVRARWLDQQGDKTGALELFRMIAMLYPANEVIQTRYFDLAMEVRDHGEAEIALENLLRIHPERYEEYRELQGDLQVWRRRFASAADVYRELLQTRPDDIALRAKVANALLWGHDYADALREYRELTTREPNEPAHLLGMARAASGAGDREEAADLFARLFEMRMLPENSIVEYGWILNDLGRTAELRTLAEDTLAQSESLEFAQKNLVTLNFWAGDYARAKSLLDSLAMQSGDDKESLLFRITLNDKLGDRAAVIEGYKRLAELEPGNIDNLITLAQLYQGEQDFEAADNYLKLAYARDDKDPRILRALAENYSYMSKLDESIRWYRALLTRLPGDREATNKLIQALLWNENYEEAGRYVERAYRDNPDNLAAKINLVMVYSRLGREDELLPVVDELIASGELTDEEREQIAINALVSNSNRLLMRMVGTGAKPNERVTELRLILARRLRAESRHLAALPVYAAVLAATPNPKPELLMEMAETANWAGRPDIATRWLEQARNIVTRQERQQIMQYDPRAFPAIANPPPVQAGSVLDSLPRRSTPTPMPTPTRMQSQTPSPSSSPSRARAGERSLLGLREYGTGGTTTSQ